MPSFKAFDCYLQVMGGKRIEWLVIFCLSLLYGMWFESEFSHFPVIKEISQSRKKFRHFWAFCVRFFSNVFQLQTSLTFFEHCGVGKRQILIAAELSAHKMGLKLSAVKWQRSETSEKNFCSNFSAFSLWKLSVKRFEIETRAEREYLHSNSHTIAMKSLISISLELV